MVTRVMYCPRESGEEGARGASFVPSAIARWRLFDGIPTLFILTF